MTSLVPRPTTPTPITAATSDEVTRAVERLRGTFATGRTRDLKWRQRQLAGIERLVHEQEGAIAAAMLSDLGRPAHDSWLGEVASTAAEAAYARKHLRRWTRKRRVGLPAAQLPGSAYYRFEPLGTTLVIGPWNYPVYLTLSPIIGALSAGNCVVVKPSEHAPATAAALADLLPRYLDPEAVTVLEGDAAVTQELLDQGFDHAFFTGGPEIGKKVMEGAAKHLTPVTLELGGKCPTIVTADADLDVAARRIAWVKLLNSGQTCIAPDYVLVQDSVREEFLEKLRGAVAQFRQGAPLLQPIVNARQFERVAGLLESPGGEVVLGGGVDREAAAIEPTVILDPDPSSELMNAEIFGPVLPVVTVSSFEAARDLVNSGPKPLAAYLFSHSRRLAKRMVDEVPSGGTVINHLAVHCTIPQLPFGGVGNSGMGDYHGKFGFETFSNRKSVLSKPARPDPSLLYPPYSDRDMSLIRRLL